MAAEAFPVSVPRSDPAWMSPLSRIWALVFAAACLTVLVVAARLPPAPSGMGTHEALGRPACGFLERTGVPCLSCGMTTSYAWFARGNLLASFYVQPMGLLLAAATAVGVWIGGYTALTGRPIHRAIARRLPLAWLVVATAGFAVLAWAYKIVLHTQGWDGWQ